jgi:hypothetical protein
MKFIMETVTNLKFCFDENFYDPLLISQLKLYMG